MRLLGVVRRFGVGCFDLVVLAVLEPSAGDEPRRRRLSRRPGVLPTLRRDDVGRRRARALDLVERRVERRCWL